MQLASDAEKFDDASTEMMLLEDGKVLLYVGESFIDVSEEYAVDYCSQKTEVTVILPSLSGNCSV